MDEGEGETLVLVEKLTKRLRNAASDPSNQV